MRTFTALLAGIALGAGGASAAFVFPGGEATPSLYTNANGRQPLRDPAAHRAAAVQYRGTVLAYRRLGAGEIVVMRIDGTSVAAHVYDPTWKPARVGQQLEVQGRIRGVLGDPIDAAGIPVVRPLWRGMTLIDVAAAIGPHASRSSGARTSKPTSSAGPLERSSKRAPRRRSPYGRPLASPR